MWMRGRSHVKNVFCNSFPDIHKAMNPKLLEKIKDLVERSRA